MGKTISFIEMAECVVVVLCTSEAVFMMLGEIGWVQGGGIPLSGHFSNPAGFASFLSFSLPLGWSTIKRRKWWCAFFLLMKFICCIAILWSGSRTGLLCLALCVYTIFFYKKWRWICFAFPVLFAITVCIKADSSRGRWFIIQRTVDLIAERPLLGWGPEGFEAHYMDVQANFFAVNPNSEYALLADNVRHPLNEFLNVAVSYGIAGLAALVVCLLFIVHYARHHRHAMTGVGLLILAYIVIFSLFSYPFHYLHTWCFLAFSLSCIFMRPLLKRRKAVGACATVTLAVIAYILISKSQQYKQFAAIQEKASYYGLAQRMLPQYASLYPLMKDDSRFLYSYAVVKYDAGLYSDALQTAKDCKLLLADYDLSLLMGDIYRKLGQKDSSIHYYNYAHNMCPPKFVPLYEIFRIHREAHDTTKTLLIQHAILNKKIKVRSRQTDWILHDVKSYSSKNQ